MVSFTTSVSWPPAAVTSVFKFSQTCRNWATRSPLPTTRPSRSLATWPARNSVRPPRVSAACEKPLGFMRDGGLWSVICRVMGASSLGAVQHEHFAVGRIVVNQLGRHPCDLVRLDEPLPRIQLRHRLHRLLERSSRPGRDAARARP